MRLKSQFSNFLTNCDFLWILLKNPPFKIRATSLAFVFDFCQNFYQFYTNSRYAGRPRTGLSDNRWLPSKTVKSRIVNQRTTLFHKHMCINCQYSNSFPLRVVSSIIFPQWQSIFGIVKVTISQYILVNTQGFRRSKISVNLTLFKSLIYLWVICHPPYWFEYC